MSARVMPRCGRPLPVSSILTATTGLVDGVPPVSGSTRGAGGGLRELLCAGVAAAAAEVVCCGADEVAGRSAPLALWVHPASADPVSSTALTAAAVRILGFISEISRRAAGPLPLPGDLRGGGGRRGRRLVRQVRD